MKRVTFEAIVDDIEVLEFQRRLLKIAEESRTARNIVVYIADVKLSS